MAIKKDGTNLLVVDLEATCWQTDSERKNQANEIIEIGYAVLDLKELKILENKAIMVVPTTSKISPFCTQLTTLKAEDVTLEAGALPYGKALQSIKAVMDKYDVFSWASYGDYDRTMFVRQCNRECFINPMPRKHMNISHLVEQINGGQRIGMDKALRLFTIPMIGTHHRGVDDAMNIARIQVTILHYNRIQLGNNVSVPETV